MISAPEQLHAILVGWLIQAVLAMAAANRSCQETCGNVQIYFPLGIGEGCFMNKGFEVLCDESFSPPKPFLTSINMELLENYTRYYPGGQVQVNNPVISSNCSQKALNITRISLSGSPFFFSSTYSVFAAIGCDNYALLLDPDDATVGGCLSICSPAAYNSSGCYGINCCQASIPPNIQHFETYMTNLFSRAQDQNRCKRSFMVDRYWLQSSESLNSLKDSKFMENVPAVLKWADYKRYCYLKSEASNVNCTLDGRYCWKEMNTSQVCIYDCRGSVGCLDTIYPCDLYCLYSPGGNCSCPPGSLSNYEYYASYHYENSHRKTKSIIIGIGSGLGFLLLLIGMWLSYRIIKRKQAEKLKQKFFKRNGGLLLEQQLSSTDNHVEKAKLFTSKELDKATDGYNVNRILGQGGQGTVYKGMLTDGRVVAIKKSKVVDEDKLDQFINEVVILSQINHRNVVKIVGCCLETEVPLLVYEFVPNGSLFQYLQEQTEELPMTWEMRLRIATEVANALSYLHSAASIPIYHRDIKSSNILLDEKYRAKVADFGTSKSISIDQTHVTTRVQGTFGYLDPEYFQSSQFTDKSDVYSFGVVLIELLTGQRPISSLRSVEERSIAAYFLASMEENRLFEIVDGRVLNEGRKEEIMGVANLARRCLNLKGKKRPTMKIVAMELEGIRASQGASSAIIEDYEEVDYLVDNYVGSLDIASSSISSTSRRLPSGLDVQPLLYSNTM